MGKNKQKKPKETTVIQNSESKKRLSLLNRNTLNKLVNDVLRVASSFQTPQSQSKLWEEHLELRKLIQEIHSIEDFAKMKSSSQHNRKSSLEQLNKWLSENGAQFDGVEISEFTGYGYGLKATKVFKEGESILKIPRKLMMTEDKAKESALSEMINWDPLLKNMSNVTLALFLLLEKSNNDSFWKPYIDSLPKSYGTVLYFTESELQSLKPSPLFEQSLNLYKCVARQYAYFYNKIHTKAHTVPTKLRDIFDYENYRWAVSTVMTRQNMIPGTGGVSTTAFIPLWDMCNHSEGKISTDFDSTSDTGECFAMKNFEIDEQIFIFYGVRSNADFFLHNGFVHPENTHDSYNLNLGLSSGDKLKEKRQELLKLLGLANTTNCSIYASGQAYSPELVAFARIFSMDEADLDRWISSEDRGQLLCLDEAPALGGDLEKKSTEYIRTRCQLLISLYERTMKAEVDSDNGKLINLLKLAEITLLKKGTEFADKRLALLQN